VQVAQVACGYVHGWMQSDDTITHGEWTRTQPTPREEVSNVMQWTHTLGVWLVHIAYTTSTH
jgi:hypothetical protein